jgi:hypothetical protein
MQAVWAELEDTLLRQFNLPHNRWDLHGRPQEPQAATAAKMAELRSGLAQVERVDFTGPQVFLRVAGPGNRVYSGEWWFEAELLDRLERDWSRLFLSPVDERRMLRDVLRELLAVSERWNPMTEVWALRLPAGERLRGYAGPGTPQQLFDHLPLSANGNRLLMGGARQIFFPVKNPLWVFEHRLLSTA